MKRTKTTRQSRRSSRYDEEEQVTVKEKFLVRARAEDQESRPSAAVKLEPKNNNQRTAIGYLNADTPIVFLTGSAGTGKSMLAAWKACDSLRKKRVSKVYLVRPAVSVGKSVGMLPGDIDEKLKPYFAQTISHMEKFMGKGHVEYCLRVGDIEMKPVEYLRGMSFENCIVIAEEVQNFTAEEMEMMLTRLGENCQIIFTGDQKQHDLRGLSGLEKTIELLKRIQATAPAYMSQEDMDELDEGIGIVQFLPADVVRSGLTRAFVKLYYNNS